MTVQRRCIAAWTEPVREGGYVSFVSVNREADGCVSIHVRQGGYQPKECAIILTDTEWVQFREEIRLYGI